VAEESGCDETILWSRDCKEEEIVAYTKKAAANGGFNAIIDLVNSQITCERAINCLRPVSFNGCHFFCALDSNSERAFIFIEVVSCLAQTHGQYQLGLVEEHKNA